MLLPKRGKRRGVRSLSCQLVELRQVWACEPQRRASRRCSVDGHYRREDETRSTHNSRRRRSRSSAHLVLSVKPV